MPRVQPLIQCASMQPCEMQLMMHDTLSNVCCEALTLLNAAPAHVQHALHHWCLAEPVAVRVAVSHTRACMLLIAQVYNRA